MTQTISVPLRIVSWNCQGGFGKKLEAIKQLNPDILLISEAYEKDIVKIDAPFTHWVGADKKGLGIVGFADHDYSVYEPYNDDLSWFVPLCVPDINLNILASWACMKSQQVPYIRNAQLAVEHYEPFLAERPSIILGDMNGNMIWDTPKNPKRSFSELLRRTTKLGMQSVYHAHTGEAQGEEQTPTFFFYRHADKPFHIDHTFASESLLDDIQLTIGDPAVWLQWSDHMPLIIDLATSPISE